MVEIVENWSSLRGTVERVAPSPEVQGFDEVVLGVVDARPVEGFPNLLAGAAGTTVAVLFPRDLVRALDLATGVAVTCRVRVAARRRVFASRDHVVLG